MLNRNLICVQNELDLKTEESVPIAFVIFNKLCRIRLCRVSENWNGIMGTAEKNPIRQEYRSAANRYKLNAITFAEEPYLTRVERQCYKKFRLNKSFKVKFES